MLSPGPLRFLVDIAVCSQLLALNLLQRCNGARINLARMSSLLQSFCVPNVKLHKRRGHLGLFIYLVFLLFHWMVNQIIVEQPILKVHCTLGEGPVYDPDAVLHFVDIDERKILHYNTVTHELAVEQFDHKVACLALRKDGPGLAGAAAEGFALFEGESKMKYLSQPLPAEYKDYTRFNDGACDSHGRFFAGTVYDKERGIPGQLWMLDVDGSCKVADPGPFTDSNGLGWSPDEKIFYFTDSRANLIYAYDYDDGKLTNRRVFVDAMALGLEKDSYCDGLCVDTEGYVWSARWGGSKIVRFSPSGSIDLEVVFPSVLNVTSCAFGGPNNDQLYVTSAHCKASGEEERQAQFPDSGHLFVVDLSGRSYRGVPVHRY
ncbi:SMP-30/Gluconolaconase/LRE-like region-domain-containing protein [Mycena filopes]|nr:SMP-30/Gluconolaconase/LRE-like region-domain-containing protein [Mycena filopes]